MKIILILIFLTNFYCIIPEDHPTTVSEDTVKTVEKTDWLFPIGQLDSNATLPKKRAYHSMAYADTKKVLLFGGEDKDGTLLDDTWEFNYDKQSQQDLWKEFNSLGTKPAARNKHEMVYAGDHTIVLFGGHDGTNALNDTWEYDTESHVWTLKKEPGGAGDINCTTGTDCPELRYSFALAGDSSQKKAYLFGGLDDDDTTLYNDTWVYDLSTHTWSKVTFDAEDDLPPLRKDAVLSNADSDKLILFGGSNASGIFSDSWEFDIKTSKWKRYNASGIRPTELKNSSLAFSGKSYLYLFGGLDFGLETVSENWLYNRSKHIWSKEKTSGTVAVDVPLGRYALGSAYLQEGKILIFGGIKKESTTETYLQDTWIYDLSKLQ